MKLKISLLSAIFVLSALLTGGCALSHEPIFRITDPQNGNVFSLNQNVTVRVRVFRNSISNFGTGDWQGYEWRLYDGQTLIAEGSASNLQSTFDFAVETSTSGPHYISAQARAMRSDPGGTAHIIYSDWLNSNEVCFFVGPDAPEDFCSVRTIAQPLVVASVTLTPIPLTPTATIIPTIPVRKNPNQHGGSGCSQYTTQSSCQLAGCSWNYGSCVVNP